MKARFNKSLIGALNLFIKGGERMLLIFYILILAWTLGSVCTDLHTGQYIAENIKLFISPTFFPMIIFIIGAFISLATGSSYGTFAILMPIALPVAHELDASLYVTIGAILSGGLFGDHTSPISETTVLSSMGAGCDHLKHVKTQMVYAALTGGVSAVCFIISTIVESPAILLFGFALQTIAIYLVSKRWGRNAISALNR